MKDERRWWLPQAGLLLLVLALFLGGGRPDALAQTTCPNTDRTLDYNCPVGPTYLIPGLTDVNGWNQPAHYENILTGDITGDGVDELVARGPMGVVVYRFDTTHGQWSQVAVDPILSDKDGWGQPKYYSTIQLARLFPPPDSTKLIARSSDGIVVYQFEPGPTPDTGSWTQLSTSGPLGDKSCFSNGKCWGDDPSYYSTIQVGDLGAGVTNRLVARGADGLVTYEWDGSAWNPLPTLTELSDANGWNKPEYYSTIRVWSNGEILLARGPAGMLVYQLEPVGGTPTSWQKVGTSGPFADNACFANGKCWNSGPQYYSTIQLAPNPGAGDPLVIGRGGDGVEFYIGAPAQTGGPWVWQALRDKQGAPFSDAAGFDKPEYYRTIRIDNFSGARDLELVGRGPTGVTTYDANPAQQSGPWPAPLVAGEPVLADDPWAKCACYYDTFRTADVTGSGAHVLLARGAHGIRTWRFNKPNATWSRYQSYGNYPMLDHAAFTALNSFLGITSGTVRTVYTDPNSPPPDPNQLQNWQNTIASTCSGPLSGAPPKFQSCTPPPSASGVPAAAWTAVSNQIIAELFWAGQVLTHFKTIENLNTQLFLDQNSEFPAIDKELALGQASTVAAEVDYLGLLEEAFSLASLIPFIGDALQGVFEVTSSALGIAAAATPTGSGSAPSRFDHKFSEMQSQIATIQQQTQDANSAHQRYVLGDYGLLQAVGHLVNSQVWKLDTDAMRSAGRQTFTLWAYNGLLPVLWDRWNVTDCFPGRGGGAPACVAPQNGDGMKSYSNNSGSITFDGLVPTQRPCDHQFVNQHCVWSSLETQDYADALKTLRGTVAPECQYDPAAGHSWEYGVCSLGQQWTDLEATDASGSPRWPFDKRSCLFRVDNQDCYNAQPSSVQRGELRGIGTPFSSLALSVAEPLSDSLDLRNATVTLGHLLHEVGGAGELVNDANGADLAPRVHTVRSFSRNTAIFQSSPRERPRILGLLSVSGGKLRVNLQIGGAPLDTPQLCGSDGISHLHTHLLVDDGVNRPVQTLITVPWHCITDGNGVVRNLRVPR